MTVPRPIALLCRRLKLSLAARLTVWFAVMAFAMLFAASLLMYWRVAAHLTGEDEFVARMRLMLVEALLTDAVPAPDTVQIIANSTDRPSDGPMYVRVLLPGGDVLAQTDGMDGELPAAIIPVSRKPVRVLGASGRAYWAASSKVMGDTVQVAAEADDEVRLLAPYRGHMGVLFGLAFLAAGVIGHRIARHGLQPVVTLVETMRGIETTTLDKRIDVARLPIELTALGETFNDMLERLQRSFNRVAQCSDDIAHQLRTPLGIVRGQIEVALGAQRSPADYREILESSLEEIVTLSDLVHRMLFLARAENQAMALSREETDIGRLLSSVHDLYEPVAGEAGVALEVSVADPPLAASIDRLLTLRAIGNLVSNAIRHAPPGSTVAIQAAPGGGGDVRITVADTGQGIAADHLPHMFERFYRAEPSDSGARSGLGLAIVKAIAALHGGGVGIVSTPGQGTRVTITFAAPRPAG